MSALNDKLKLAEAEIMNNSEIAMLEESSLLETFYRKWRDYHQALVKVIAPLSDQQLSLRAAPHLRSIGAIIGHMIAGRVRMIHSNFGEGNAELTPLAQWDAQDAPIRTGEELLKGLASSWTLIEEVVQKWNSTQLAEQFEAEWPNGEKYTYSRQLLLSYAMKHDFHHGGELSLTLGIHHLPTPEWT